ncbi:TraB/GumN family protein [Paenibacillus turpanensis]|uniref:TraB/GumN family protein n=1 Tax=Paenibacillus turpanensis TaxID=2689078 RepID=UPI001FB84F8D|nr:TraB/GumN family protein [Paenibacillus turpanensis]
MSVTLLSATMLAAAVPAYAAADQVEVLVNGKIVDYGAVAPFIEEGTTLVPMEPTLKALNISADTVKLPTAPREINGESYVPLRAIGEAAGFEVKWDAASYSVLLVSTIPTEDGARGFLWEVVSHDGDKVYLVGSMHIADDSFYPLHESFEQAFAESEYLGVEIDVSKAADPEVQKLVSSLGMYQNGTTLKDHISEETYTALGEILKKNGMATNALDSFKPWVAETTIATLQSMQAGYEAQIGIDLYFTQKAAERDIPLIELESYESQLNMFNGFSKELQEFTLKSTIENYDSLGETVDQMAKVWKKGDEAGLLELIGEMAENEEYNQAMLVDRNIQMADKIEGFLNDPEEADYFVVVGAAHFPGEDGIVKLLEEKGYDVVRK